MSKQRRVSCGIHFKEWRDELVFCPLHLVNDTEYSKHLKEKEKCPSFENVKPLQVA